MPSDSSEQRIKVRCEPTWSLDRLPQSETCFWRLRLPSGAKYVPSGGPEAEGGAAGVGDGGGIVWGASLFQRLVCCAENSAGFGLK